MTTTTPETDVAEVLEPAVAHHKVTVGVEPNSITYTQKPLSFFGKMEFFAVMGKALDSAMAGPEGFSVDELVGAVGSGGVTSTQELIGADQFVQAIARIATFAPEIIADLYCVILAVPRGDRDLAKYLMEQPEDEGGLSDEAGFQILNVFVDQNWETLSDFFGKRIKPLMEKVQGRMSERQPSKPSKATRTRTPKPSKS